jgi:hypothetical protein
MADEKTETWRRRVKRLKEADKAWKERNKKTVKKRGEKKK